MTDSEELHDLASMLDKKAKLADAKAALHRHHGRTEDDAKETGNASYCRRKAEVCRRAAGPKPPKSNGVSEGKDPDRIPTTDQSRRIATLYNRRHTTAWSEKEVEAYRKLGTIPTEDLALIEAYYATERARGDLGLHRRDLGTFLNNFAGELDRAREASTKPATARKDNTVPLRTEDLPPIISYDAQGNRTIRR